MGVIAPATATAHAPATNGWYWPTGTTATGRGGGWLQYRSRNHSFHLAKDIRARVGAPVYALADGYVYDAYRSLNGYRPGGAMVVVYRDMYGNYFKALYGHVRRLKYKRGQRVTAGTVLAYVAPCGGCPHLHFGVHMGLARPNDPRHNPFMGHSYVRGRTYGWVDPLAFLRTASPLGTPVPVSPVEPTSTPVPTSTVEATPAVAPTL